MEYIEFTLVHETYDSLVLALSFDFRMGDYLFFEKKPERLNQRILFDYTLIYRVGMHRYLDYNGIASIDFVQKITPLSTIEIELKLLSVQYLKENKDWVEKRCCLSKERREQIQQEIQLIGG